MKEKNYIQSLHNSTVRDYLGRMIDEKVEAMSKARLYDYDYWDGDRRYGYGGYKYIPGRWQEMAAQIIRDYALTSKSKILDVGSGRGFLLFELQKLLPGVEIHGLDISSYAINSSHPELEARMINGNASKLDFEDKYFDFTLSVNTLHNLKLSECISALGELERVSDQKYVVVESYRNLQELFNLQCWALTANLILSVEDWLHLFELSGYSGDYEWIFFP